MSTGRFLLKITEICWRSGLEFESRNILLSGGGVYYHDLSFKYSYFQSRKRVDDKSFFNIF